MQLISSLEIKPREYLSKDRFISYYNQFRLISSLGNQVENILEIGVFYSLLTDILRSSGYKVTTADVDPNLQPDMIVDLTTDSVIPKDKFDAIVLFQVLEHIPYEESEKALKKLAEATKKFLVISIPYSSEFVTLQIKCSFFRRPRHLCLKIPKFWVKQPQCDQHYWEIGLKGYPKKRILNSIKAAGLTVKHEFIDPSHQYHYFLILEKKAK